MTLHRRVRRRIDALIAAVIVIGLAVTAAALYLGSDVRATTLETAPTGAVPTTPTAPREAPTAVRQVWQLDADPDYPAVVTPYGTVARTRSPMRKPSTSAPTAETIPATSAPGQKGRAGFT